WLMILLVSSEGRAVGRLALCGCGSAAGGQIKNPRGARSGQLGRRDSRSTPVGCRWRLGGFGLRLVGLGLVLGGLSLGRPTHLCVCRGLVGVLRSTDEGKEAYQY